MVLSTGPREWLPPTFGPGGRSAADFWRFCAFAATFFTAFFGFFFVAFFGAGAFFTAFFATIFTGFFFFATAFAMSLWLTAQSTARARVVAPAGRVATLVHEAGGGGEGWIGAHVSTDTRLT